MLKILEKPDKASYPPSLLSSHRLFMNFCESLLSSSHLKDFLYVLQAQIPKKWKRGEILLFYDSQSMGLRRAYIKNKNFYEQSAQNLWPQGDRIRFSHKKENDYFSRELGRPFSKALMIPLSQSPALLLVEVDRFFSNPDLLEFFKERKEILDLVFKRLALNSQLSRVSYLWSQLFFYWEEPIALLKDYKILKSNQAFQDSGLGGLDFLQKKQISGSIESQKSHYQLYYYELDPTRGILYAQDISKYLFLKAQWIQSEKMSSLARLGKNMSHQLNNPLAGVKAMTQILKKEPEAQAFKADLRELEKSLLRSQKIIQSLLSFSSEAGSESLCDLNQVLQDTLSLLKSVTKGISIKRNFHPKPLKLKGDFSLFQQIVYNLILNACQALATDKDNPNPTLSVSSQLISKQRACLKIQDNGIGIPTADLKKIFDPLWSSKKQGTGFGLSLTQKFVKSLGGEIFVSSKEKQGTCFTLIFPLAPAPPPSAGEELFVEFG